MHVHVSLSQSSLSMPASEHLSKFCSSHIFLYASFISVCLFRVRPSPVRRHVYCMYVHLLYVPPICLSVSCVYPPTTCMPIRVLYARLVYARSSSKYVRPFYVCPSISSMFVRFLYAQPDLVCLPIVYNHPPLVCPFIF